MIKKLIAVLLVSISLHLLAPASAYGKSSQVPSSPPKGKQRMKEEIALTRQAKKFSMYAPKGWYCIDEKSELPGKIELIYIGEGNGKFTPSINLATEKTEMGLEEYVAMAKKYHESQAETICTPLGALSTKAGEAELLQIDRKTPLGQVRFLQATWIQNKRAYVMTATCLVADFSELSCHYFHSFQSFTILKNDE